MSLVEVEYTENSSDNICYVYLNNPSSKNSMTWAMGELFQNQMNKLSVLKRKPKVIILSGKNDVFCAGGDLNLLRSFSTKTFSQNRKGMRTFYNFFLSVRKVPIPILCVAKGHAIGAGLALPLACDLRIFSNEGKYSFNFVKLGIHPGMGSSYTTPELIGKSKANRMLFLAETINGIQAAEWGLCDYSFPKEVIMEEAKKIADGICEAAPLAMQELKKNSYSDKALQKALKMESESQARNFISKDFKETMASIVEKRKPIFIGE
ncbi:MAG: enoyl-CoA hydratase/isomerase family protein [Leptospiraceae bacterium]|nr:enoyl-CoA hydratase/isomerase family protein [Leptospiraceae bacterium]MCZ8345703.1 enoyl-CoA hydratase/isomerase family protein [Leptospiraceae bacterium]